MLKIYFKSRKYYESTNYIGAQIQNLNIWPYVLLAPKKQLSLNLLEYPPK